MSWIDDLAPGYSGWRTWQATAHAALEVFCCRGRSAGPLALITAGVHGDEYEGPAAVFSLAQLLTSDHVTSDRVRGTIIALPVANPAAFAAGTRMHPEDGRNLARTFPGSTRNGPSGRLAAAIFEELAAPADYLIDLHSGGVEYVFLPVAGFYGEPAGGNPSFQAARMFGLPALWQLPETDGVLSCEAWRRGKIAIGTEYLGAGQLSADGVRDYRNGVAACLAHWGMLASVPQKSKTPDVFAGDWQVASAGGIFTAHCRIGDAVAKGTTLALITGLRGQVLQEFVSTCDGVILGLRSKAYIRETNWAVLVGRRIA
jgi:N-alpha-acetyl-L-2,4-diaminobutyrate deacetylase